MKKVIIVLLLLTVNYSMAQHNFFARAGTNVSWFVDAENAQPKLGYSIGIDKGFHIYKGLSWELGIGYTTRGASLKDRTIRPYFSGSEDINAYYWDINAKMGYVDFPIAFKYNFKINKELKISPIIGTTIAIPTKDYSNFKQKEFYKIYNTNINDWDAYDYNFEQEPAIDGNVRYLYGLGLQISYLRFAFDIKYNFDNYKDYTFKKVRNIKFKMHTISVAFSYEL